MQAVWYCLCRYASTHMHVHQNSFWKVKQVLVCVLWICILFFTSMTKHSCLELWFQHCYLCYQVDSLPKDDGTLNKKREELQKEVEQTKRALATQVTHHLFLFQYMKCSFKKKLLWNRSNKWFSSFEKCSLKNITKNYLKACCQLHWYNSKFFSKQKKHLTDMVHAWQLVNENHANWYPSFCYVLCICSTLLRLLQDKFCCTYMYFFLWQRFVKICFFCY